MRQHHAIRFATAAFAAGALAGFDARAGVRRDDVADSEHTTTLLSDGRYHSVGAISFGFGGRGSGTLITPRWVLTAGHVVDSTAERRFNYSGTDYDNGTSITATHWFAHPNWSRANLLGGFDIGLVRLDRKSVV